MGVSSLLYQFVYLYSASWFSSWLDLYNVLFILDFSLY